MQQNLSFDDRFIVAVGLRHDWLNIEETLNGVDASDDFSETSIRGALTWKISNEISTMSAMANPLRLWAWGSNRKGANHTSWV